MPLFKIKRVWDYCSYNKPFFILVLILIFILNFIREYSLNILDLGPRFILQVFIIIMISGYGISITKDRINHGYRLPKIMPKRIIILGVKSIIVFAVYLLVQYCVLYFISLHYGFPIFDLEEMLLDFEGTAQIIFAHNPYHTLIFIVVSAAVFYVTTFFAEIGLAKLADTESILSAFNLVSIFRSIDIFGWKNYTRDVTSIIIAMVILSYVSSIDFQYFWLNSLWGTLMGFLIFATQYLGIGSVYCNIKDMEQGL